MLAFRFGDRGLEDPPGLPGFVLTQPPPRGKGPPREF